MGGSVTRHTGRRPPLRALAFGLALLGAAAACAAARDAESELDGLLKRLNALDAWLDEAGRRIASGQSEVASADRGIAAVNGRIRELDARIESGRLALARLSAERERLGGTRLRQAEQMAEHLRDAWRFQERDPLQALFNLEDPRTFGRMIRYHAAFAKALAELVDDLRETLAMLAENESGRSREQRALAAARGSADADRAALVSDRGKRQRLIENLHAEFAQRTDERERLLRDRKRLQSLLAELVQESRRATGGIDRAARKGELAWPVQGRIVRRFGQARAGGRLRWEGVAFAAPEGSEVRAVAPGRVVFSNWLRGFGLLAIVDHGDGWMSLYGSVDAIYKRDGDAVESGEVIATAGQSGGETEVGLYFEMRLNGESKDPMAWLRSDARRERSR